MGSTQSPAQGLKPAEALDRYLSAQKSERPGCSDRVFAVRIDAFLPALKKRGSMTGLKWIAQTGQIVYRGLRFTGDNLVKTQVIARFLARDTDRPPKPADTAITAENYGFAFEGTSNYNGLPAYVFLLRPRRKRAGLFRGELWLNTETAAPLRVWGDLVKAPSLFVRSLRFVQDYQPASACADPLRLMLTARALIAGTVEVTVWSRPAQEEAGAVTESQALWDESGDAGPEDDRRRR